MQKEHTIQRQNKKTTESKEDNHIIYLHITPTLFAEEHTMATKLRLGELLVQENLISQNVVDDALRIQVSGNKRLGSILLQMGVLTSDQLTDLLSQQMEIPLIDIDKEFTPEVKKLLPRYLCKKYDALPLAAKDNNILLTAMTDPSDQEAITDIEHYTGKLVEPCLSKQSDIKNAIREKIPFSLKDVFNPQANTKLTRSIATAAFALAIMLGAAGYKYIHTAKYGTVSHLSNATIYEHHELMLGFDNAGKISLLGHSAFSKGYYSASFNNVPTLLAFVESSKNDFSTKQYEWIAWVLKKEGQPVSAKENIASSGN